MPKVISSKFKIFSNFIELSNRQLLDENYIQKEFAKQPGVATTCEVARFHLKQTGEI